MKKSTLRSLLVFGLAMALPAFAFAQGWTAFSAISGPIGVACVGDGPDGIDDKLVVTSYVVGTGIYTIDEAGTATWRPLAGLPNWRNVEVYIAVSVGLGDWPSNRIYLIKGGEIWEVSDDLTSVSLFAFFSGKPGTHSGITFDRTGVWGFDMIITFQNGEVYRVDPTGASTYIGSSNGIHESPRVITDDSGKWGAFAGCITTASENRGAVYAFCPDQSGGYSFSTLASGLSNSESSDLRPAAGETTFGSTPYVYFLSAYNRARVVGYTAAQMPTGSQGDLFVSREYSGGIFRIDAPGSTSTFASGFNEHYEGSNFCFAANTIDTSEICLNGIDDDDDTLIDGDDPDCIVCGDDDLDTGEECDDGNVVNGDGCDENCQNEAPPECDADGIPDAQDNCPCVDNADQADSDMDGSGDACDTCPFDPLDDADGDGVCGDVDNCPSDANGDQTDTDGDGLGDVCDHCPLDDQNDADGDGVCGDVDNCPSDSNANQTDTDGDGLGDVCDHCPLDDQNDADGDGVCGDVDNCPSDSNANQTDTDGDGLGDVCDHCPLDPLNDVDGDGVCGDVDNCPTTANAGQQNTDGDDLGDACDACDDSYIIPGVDEPGANGCTQTDDCGNANNHGQCVSCMRHLINDWRRSGAMTVPETQALQDLVAHQNTAPCDP